jgi:hypothetical protein
MAQPVEFDNWRAIGRRRRWGCFGTFVVVVVIGVVVLGFLLWAVRPGQPLHPFGLVGSDVDGLVILDLHRTSPRVERMLQVFIRPLSYEVQSKPADLEKEISQQLNVMTFRQAIGLLRYDPVAERDRWACVIPLKRMGDWLKLLVRQLATGPEASGVKSETANGVLYFWGREGWPCFAIEQRAIVIADERGWLDVVVERVRNPLEKTPRANRLFHGLPAAGKHRVVRAHVLMTPERWEGWAVLDESDVWPCRQAGRVRRLLEQAGLDRSDFDSLALATTVQPAGQLEIEVTLPCGEGARRTRMGRRLRADWPDLAGVFATSDTSAVSAPTTTSAGVKFGWTTQRLETLLGLGPAERPAP